MKSETEFNAWSQRLKDAERVARITMILILLTAGTSKFFSAGGFQEYYSGLFAAETLRITLPPVFVQIYLAIVPFIEIGLGLALISNRFKTYTVFGWFAFMLSLLFGHYILEEWSAVNQMIDYILLGIVCYVLPQHEAWLRRDPA